MPNTTAVRTAQVGAASFFAGKNAIINGGFDIWQRGTSVTGGNNVYTADRFSTFTDSETRTVSRQVTGDTTNLPNIQYCARFSRPSGNTGTGRLMLGGCIETSATIPFVGQTVTMSFYARAGANFSASSSNLSVILQYGTGTDQNVFVGFTGNTNLVNTTKTLTTTWQRFSVTATVPTSATQLGYQVGYTPTGTAGAADYYEITGWQLELGSVPTTFTRAGGTLAGELAACQRYYEKSYASATAIGTASVSQAFNGFYTVGTNQKMVNPGIWKVQKRTSPTVTVYDDAGNSGKISTLDTGGTATNNVAIAIIDTDDTSFRALGSSNGTQAGYKWNWVASAEL